MLDLSPQNLIREIRDSQANRDKYLDIVVQLRRRYAGAYYHTGMKAENATPENYPFAYIAFVLPQIFFQMPSSRFEATRSLADQPTADGMTAAMNYWTLEAEAEDPTEHCVIDALFGFGVMLTTVEGYGDHGGRGLSFALGDSQQRAMWPAIKRLSPKNVLWDPLADAETTSRFMGHTFERDLDDVQAQAEQDDTWIPEAVAELLEKEQCPEDDDKEAFPRGLGERTAKRKVVKLHQLYIPEAGRLITLAESSSNGDGLIVRDQEYFGPDEGPYTLFGVYRIPDQFVPLSVLVATFEQFLEVQTHAMKAADDAAAHKKVAVGKADAGKDAEIVKEAKNGDFLKLQNPDSVKDLEIGGASQDQLGYLGVTRERLDRVMGFSDAQRGEANSDTATANNLAQQNSDKRIGYMRKQIRKCVHRVLRKVAWYFWNLDAIRMRFVTTDARTGEPIEGTFVGGRWPGGYVDTPQGPVYQPPENPDTEFTDVALRIDEESMDKQDDPVYQKRAQDQLELAMNLQKMGIPVNWRFAVDDYGRAFNKVDYSKRLLLDVAAPGQPGAIPPDPYAASSGMVPMQPGAQQAMGPAPASSRPYGQGGATFGASPAVRMGQGVRREAVAV